MNESRRKIEIETSGIVLDRDLRLYVERRAESVFGILGRHIDSLQIRLTEVAEARDRKDKSCLVRIVLRERYRFIAEIMDPDLRIAIRRAVDRARWTAARRLQRRGREAFQLTIGERRPIGYREPDCAA